MCFSAGASFAVGAALIPLGVLCVSAAVRKDRGYLPLSLVPLLFGVQQLCEGLVWRGLTTQNPNQTTSASLLFLFFALVLWPCWIPLSAVSLEARSRYKVALCVVAALALVGGLSVYVPLALHPAAWVRMTIAGHSIRYQVDAPWAFNVASQGVWQALYVLVVSAPLIVTGNRRFTVFSGLLVVSAAVSQVFFWFAFTSVWCFFAALLSTYLCYMFQALPERPCAAVR